MKDEFVTYEIAKELRELGFNESCFGYYTTYFKSDGHHCCKVVSSSINDEWYTIAPLWQQAFEWFRKEHNVLATIYSNASGYLFDWSDAVGGTQRGWSEYSGDDKSSGAYSTYEKAREACLLKLIELVKSKS